MRSLTYLQVLAVSLVLMFSSAALAFAPWPFSDPALIAHPDCGNSFTMDLRPRRNPQTLGTLTADGYPVLLDRQGVKGHYVMPRGSDLPNPVRVPSLSSGYGHFSGGDGHFSGGRGY
ncbi:MAG: hypothetical protein GX256_07060 [Fretibacterium sp.]|nr:hypothetical protein [Fretibacterium sp.]